MFIELTSVMSGQKFDHRADDITGIEQWSAALSGHPTLDPMNAIPANTGSLIRIHCGLVMPVEESREEIKALINQAIPA